MWMLLILLIVEIILFSIIYKKNRYDLISPTNFSLFIFIVATFFAILGSSIWSIEISFETVLILFSGLLLMCISQFIGKCIANRKCMNIRENLNRINISTINILLIEILVLFLTIMYILDILKSGQNLGANGLAAISAVRYSNSNGTNALIRQGIKIVMASSFVDSFIFIHNLMVKKKPKDYLHLISIGCSFLCSLFTGVRTEILRIIFALFVYYYLNIKRSKGWDTNVLTRLIRKFLPIFLLFCLIFTSMRSYVKTSDLPINDAFNIFEYVVYYIGSPILVFGIKNQLGLTLFKRTLFGELTFNTFWENLAQMGLINDDYLSITSTNVYISKIDRVTANVDTIFGAPIIDFGYIGMLIYIFVLYLLLSLIYYKYIYLRKENKLLVIFYAFLFYIPGMAYYANVLGQYLAPYFLTTIICIVGIYIFYFKVKITL